MIQKKENRHVPYGMLPTKTILPVGARSAGGISGGGIELAEAGAVDVVVFGAGVRK